MQKILYSQGYNLNQRHSHSVYNAAQRIFTSSGRHPATFVMAKSVTNDSFHIVQLVIFKILNLFEVTKNMIIHCYNICHKYAGFSYMLIVFVCLPLSMSVATVHVACSRSLYINNILVSLFLFLFLKQFIAIVLIHVCQMYSHHITYVSSNKKLVLKYWQNYVLLRLCLKLHVFAGQ